ncbi:MAG: glycosyltransferase [Bacteroidota bacterium]|nr:glycosyltransferase [Bacteroidota bacterium]MDX5404889.1 glycosyltransferase [Bacteroidota bacterium]MDX5506063.1 glycosyltransferase [Bacteroidota bacterium]
MKTSVSVIIPFKDRFDLVDRAVASVMQQTYSQFEIILVNDGSTSSLEREYLMDSRVQYLENPQNQGPGRSRDNGLQVAKGKYVAFLDSDDYWHPEFLSSTVEEIEKDEDLPFVYSYTAEVNSNGEVTGRRRGGNVRAENILPTILKTGRPWSTSSCLWRKSVIDRIGGYPEGYIYEDYVLDTKAALISNKVSFVARDLTFMDMEDDGKITKNFTPEKCMRKLDSLQTIIGAVKDSYVFGADSVRMRLYTSYVSTLGQLLDRMTTFASYPIDRYLSTLEYFDTVSVGERIGIQVGYRFMPQQTARFLRYKKRVAKRSMQRIPEELVFEV